VGIFLACEFKPSTCAIYLADELGCGAPEPWILMVQIEDEVRHQHVCHHVSLLLAVQQRQLPHLAPAVAFFI
jgi:hypothetical protein